MCGREKAIRGLRKKPISTSAKEVSTLSSGVYMNISVTIPGKVHVQKLMFVKAKQVQTLKE